MRNQLVLGNITCNSLPCLAHRQLSHREMSRSDYQYEPLPSAETHIRLLEILPRSDARLIPLTLRTIPLSEAAGNYDAISYTWGTFLPVHEVSVDGQRLWLRENVWRFLRHCSSTELGEKHHRNLWIDSICINQKDVPEKNAQVQRMAAIFSQARQVIVWLGKASQTSLWAELTLGRYVRMAEFMREAHGRHGTPEDGDVSLRTDIRQLMTSPYWTRLWIVQELALAHQAVIVSGTELCDLTVFLGCASLARYFFRVDETDTEDTVWRAAAKQVDQLVQRHLYRETQSAYHGLAPLVESFAAQECYDPHDHVYGLLGLLEGGHSLPIDYNIDMEVLFWQVLEVTHQQVSAMFSGARRDSYQWNLEILLEIFQLRLKDIFAHDALQHRLVHDRFAVEMKNNGRVIPPSDAQTDISTVALTSNTSVFSLVVSWYYYGDLSILVSSDLSYAKLAYVSDPLNVAFAGDIFDSSVDTREMAMSGSIRQDLVVSMREQNMTHGILIAMAEAGGSLSVGFSFRSLVELSRLSAIGNEYLQPAEKKKGEVYVSSVREWPEGFPWDEVMEKVESARASIPTNAYTL